MTNSIKAGITAVVLSLGLATPIAAEPLEDGTASYRSGDYGNAIRRWQPLADEGSVKEQPSAATKSERKIVPAEQFEDGFSAYRRGDYAAAMRIFRALAEQGNARAQWYLGTMYLFGDGVPQNDAEAMKWYLQAAEKGYAFAQSGLGMIYKRGYGVPQNYILAYMWYTLAAHDPDAEPVQQDHLAEIAPHMAPSQIAEARRLAQRCLQSHYADCSQTREVRSANWSSAVDFADSPTPPSPQVALPSIGLKGPSAGSEPEHTPGLTMPSENKLAESGIEGRAREILPATADRTTGDMSAMPGSSSVHQALPSSKADAAIDLQDTKPLIERERQAGGHATCFPSASAVRQDNPAAFPSWTLRAPGHEGTKCWYAATPATVHDHRGNMERLLRRTDNDAHQP